MAVATLNHRSQVAPGIYLVAIVRAELGDGEVLRTSTSCVRLEEEDGTTVRPEEWPALNNYWLGLRYGRISEPDSLREAADSFVAGLESDVTEA